MRPATAASLLASASAGVVYAQDIDLQSAGALASLATADALTIAPHFALLEGRTYELTLNLDGGRTTFDITLPTADVEAPTIVGFAPSQAVTPANTLRLYLTFSKPMARGHVRDAVILQRSDGSDVPSPFLTLAPELWDTTQTHLTLLLDPGPIKQGVGPNRSHGAPLVEGQQYRLVVDAHMKSATGVPLGRPAQILFSVGEPESDPIDPDDWHILAPPAGSRAPLTLAFDRITDTGTARRMISVRDSADQTVIGVIETDGGGWSLPPLHPWPSGTQTFTITINPALEDISGNAIGQAFDAPAGTIGTRQEPVTVTVQISA
ncbi:Ig-like domain-containing protein [Pseudooctadecabacter jejudonensis]|uniref:Ig-like domain-containing protein n=1 Tax=Pseudooctadecabacter jejudonensis TaxID=1391910 RepID=UPI00117A5F08|nr:Ig-like domain-containing protein [Pseudooctadecabacter jejudonensis]